MRPVMDVWHGRWLRARLIAAWPGAACGGSGLAGAEVSIGGSVRAGASSSAVPRYL